MPNPNSSSAVKVELEQLIIPFSMTQVLAESCEKPVILALRLRSTIEQSLNSASSTKNSNSIGLCVLVSACSTVLVPARVAQALNMKLEDRLGA